MPIIAYVVYFTKYINKYKYKSLMILYQNAFVSSEIKHLDISNFQKMQNAFLNKFIHYQEIQNVFFKYISTTNSICKCIKFIS